MCFELEMCRARITYVDEHRAVLWNNEFILHSVFALQVLYNHTVCISLEYIMSIFL